MGLTVLLCLAVLALFAILFVRSHEAAKQRAAARRLFVDDRGLRYVDASSPRIEGDVDGVQFVFDTYTESSTDSDGNSTSSTYTRLRAQGPRRFDAKVRVYREHLFSGLGRMLGFQDVQVGDSAFDEAFTIKTDDEPRARELFSGSARKALLEFPKRPTVVYDHGSMELVWAGDESDPRVLDAALQLAVAICAKRRTAPG